MSLYEFLERPDLESPVLVLALDGWIDAGVGAANARAALLAALEPTTVAQFDSDELLDHRARRPTLHLVDGVVTGLTWPSVELQAASDADGRDLLLLVGSEPDHAWRAFTKAVVDLALEFGVRMVVGLGAYPAPVPHTRPTRLAITAGDATLVGPNMVRATIDVPAGVQAAIERRATEVGLAAIGLWAQVPHYVAAMPYPAASVALIEGLESVAGLRIESQALRDEAETTRQRIDSLIRENDEHVRMVQQLESASDSEQPAGTSTDLGAGPLPSGDELAAELERFLREQD
ncbi:MAG TPA: PAC2 family protein [Acidimicrobiales bacterium]|nr:PAC2 family protein [Acidimicrobiales bacterium]